MIDIRPIIGTHQMDPRDAFNQTISKFELKAETLAINSGISPQVISRYRHKKKDMNSLNLMRLVEAMPQSAKFYFFSLLSQSPVQREAVTA
jgi:hypothetical protein